MADEIPITVRFGDDDPLIEFPTEAVTVSVSLTPVGDRLYRLDSVPIFAESAKFGDVIEVEFVEVGRFRFIQVVEKGGWRTFDYTMPSHNSIAIGRSHYSES